MGFLRPPLPEDLLRAAEREHLDLSLEESEELAPFAADFVRAFDDVEELPDVQVPVRYPRTPAYASLSPGRSGERVRSGSRNPGCL